MEKTFPNKPKKTSPVVRSPLVCPLTTGGLDAILIWGIDAILFFTAVFPRLLFSCIQTKDTIPIILICQVIHQTSWHVKGTAKQLYSLTAVNHSAAWQQRIPPDDLGKQLEQVSNWLFLS